MKIPSFRQVSFFRWHHLSSCQNFRPILKHIFSFSTAILLPPPIAATGFQERRLRLIEEVRRCITLKRQQKGDSTLPMPIAILFSRRRQFSAPGIPHPYRQCSNFLYLCGIDYPDCRLVVQPQESVLFVVEPTPYQVIWDGAGPTFDELKQISGVDKVLPMSEFTVYLAPLIAHPHQYSLDNILLLTDLDRWREERFFNGYQDHNPDQHQVSFCPDMSKSNLVDFMTLSATVETIYARQSVGLEESSLLSLPTIVDQLRWVKTRAEQDQMRAACRIGAEALNTTIASCRRFNNESSLIAHLSLESRRRGAARLAYPPVVASGQNACTLHYIKSDEALRAGDCVLIDSGAELRTGYCSDITRCFPWSGRFTGPQKILYDVLEYVQCELLEYVKNRRPLLLSDLHVHMRGYMADALIEAGFFIDQLSRDEAIWEVDQLCQHHVSHYLGLDVHDTPTMSRAITVPANVVITVEPGLYVPRPTSRGICEELQQSLKAIREEFYGIGFRIEDDVLMMDTGAEVLTDSCVRRSNNIEFLMATDQMSYSTNNDTKSIENNHILQYPS